MCANPHLLCPPSQSTKKAAVSKFGASDAFLKQLISYPVLFQITTMSHCLYPEDAAACLEYQEAAYAMLLAGTVGRNTQVLGWCCDADSFQELVSRYEHSTAESRKAIHYGKKMVQAVINPSLGKARPADVRKMAKSALAQAIHNLLPKNRLVDDSVLRERATHSSLPFTTLHIRPFNNFDEPKDIEWSDFIGSASVMQVRSRRFLLLLNGTEKIIKRLKDSTITLQRGVLGEFLSEAIPGMKFFFLTVRWNERVHTPVSDEWPSKS